jgi:hypothetical protein
LIILFFASALNLSTGPSAGLDALNDFRERVTLTQDDSSILPSLGQALREFQTRIDPTSTPPTFTSFKPPPTI